MLTIHLFLNHCLSIFSLYRNNITIYCYSQWTTTSQSIKHMMLSSIKYRIMLSVNHMILFPIKCMISLPNKYLTLLSIKYMTSMSINYIILLYITYVIILSINLWFWCLLKTFKPNSPLPYLIWSSRGFIDASASSMYEVLHTQENPVNNTSLCKYKKTTYHQIHNIS
jgi:hypothetical protein